MNTDPFWASFYTDPAVVPPTYTNPVPLEEQNKLLESACKALLKSIELVDISAKALAEASDDWAFESPLTPGEMNPKLLETSSVGDTFFDQRWRICKCKNRACKKSGVSDWYSGSCGEKVLVREPYSFIHVNLSRRCDSTSAFTTFAQPLFKQENLSFRILPGDSGTTLAVLTSDRKDEKDIRKLLRSRVFRREKGIRIFQITARLAGK